MGILKDRTGETKTTRHGQVMTIIKYNNCHDIDVEFDDGTIVENVEYSNFVKDTIKNPCRPSVCGVGYIGIGEYSFITNKRIYMAWRGMLERCYVARSLNRSRGASYKECSVDSRFYNFQYFCNWFINNIWDEKCIILDKDILIKNNKIYSPESCILVDQRINCLFTKRSNYRGNCCIGVKYYNNHYVAQCNDVNGVRRCLGWFGTEIEAFNCYKEYKEKVIKQVADIYKEKYENFPQKLYNAMYCYEIDYND